MPAAFPNDDRFKLQCDADGIAMYLKAVSQFVEQLLALRPFIEFIDVKSSAELPVLLAWQSVSGFEYLNTTLMAARAGIVAVNKQYEDILKAVPELLLAEQHRLQPDSPAPQAISDDGDSHFACYSFSIYHQFRCPACEASGRNSLMKNGWLRGPQKSRMVMWCTCSICPMFRKVWEIPSAEASSAGDKISHQNDDGTIVLVDSAGG